jgi:hypothetical protein
VIAAENGTRPAGSVTYEASNSVALADAILRVLNDRDAVARAIPSPTIADTLVDEARVLTT